MEIPSDVLSKLVCDNCQGHLSRGPALMLADGTSRCGRCIEPEMTTTAHRNVRYEELAKLMAFPCRYKVDGCNASVKFEESRQHEEETCLFRPLVCPIAEPGQCEWVGAMNCLLKHCRVQHPDTVKQNPLTLKHTIINSSLCNYILSEFQVLFLVQIKVCVTSRKIYHSVRLIGDPQRAPHYKFQIEIENNDKVVSAQGDVTPSGCLTWTEDTSVAISINGLLELLGDFTDTTFKLTVRSVEAETAKEEVTKEQVRCGKCNIVKDPPSESHAQDWLCIKCTGPKQECLNKIKGCNYSDDGDRFRTHEMYHCPYASHCVICKKTITTLTLDMHYIQSHSNIMHHAGDHFNINLTFDWQWCIVNTNFGNVVCGYNITNSTFVVHVWAPLKKSQLSQYRCFVNLDSPQFERIDRFQQPTPTALNRKSREYCDWYDDMFIPIKDICKYKYTFYVSFEKIKV